MQNNDLTTKTDIHNLKTKLYVINISKYVLKSDYDRKIGNLELKILDISGLLKTSVFNSKITEIEGKIINAENKPDIGNLATKAEVNNVENKKLTMQQKLVR